MLANLFVFLKGILFGASNLIPGMSGGTMLVITNIYEKLLDAVSNIFKKFKSVILFLILFAVGAGIGVLGGAKIINITLAYAPFPTACFFAGIILGSVPFLAKPIIKKTNWKYIIAFIAGACCVIGLMFIGIAFKSGSQAKDLSQMTLGVKDYILLFLCGFIGCIAMLIPGVSGVLMLLVFNYYGTFMAALDNLTNFGMDNYKNVILIIAPVGIGIVAGLIPATKLLSWMFKKFPVGSYFSILGFVLASVAVIFVNVEYAQEGAMTIPQIIIGAVCIPVGFVISFMLSKLKKNTEAKDEVAPMEQPKEEEATILLESEIKEEAEDNTLEEQKTE